MAIPIPNLPTDNLYKFVALTGLFVAITGVFFLEIQVERSSKAVSVLKAQVEYKNYVLDLLESADTEASLSSDQRQRLVEKLISHEEEIIGGIADSGTELDTIEKRLRPIGLISLLGSIASMIGFRLWYRRVQKPLDEILQISLEKTRLEAEVLKENQSSK